MRPLIVPQPIKSSNNEELARYIHQLHKELLRLNMDLPVIQVESEGGGGEGVDRFTKLKDTPNSYLGQGSKVVAVKASENGLEFQTISSETYIQVLSETTDIDISLNLQDGARTTIFDLNIEDDIEVNGITYNVGKQAQDGDNLVIRCKSIDDEYKLTLGSGFKFGEDIIDMDMVKTATNKIDYVGCQYNSNESKWIVLAYARGF